MQIDAGAVDPVIAAEQLCNLGGLILVAGARPVTLHFLQGDDVGAVDFARDALQVEALVPPATVLDVVGDELHHQCLNPGSPPPLF